MELVTVNHNKAVCTSLDVAERFHKRHDTVLRKIESIIDDSETAKLCFQKAHYKSEDNNKSYPMYYMNRDGFSFLVMGFTGKDENEWKWKYIEAFNYMENVLTEKKTTAWLESRQQGKLTRRSETDIIKEFVEYATEQGSGHADKYYIHFSKLADKCAGITDREMATTFQLSTLSFVERIILVKIREGIAKESNYKDIYKQCKDAVDNFYASAYLGVSV